MSQNTIIVDAYDENCVHSLSEALKIVPEGGTILIKKGFYKEGLLEIDRPITIIGERDELYGDYPVIYCKDGAFIELYAAATIKDLVVTSEAAMNNFANALMYPDDEKIYYNSPLSFTLCEAIHIMANATLSNVSIIGWGFNGIGIGIKGAKNIINPVIESCRICNNRGTGISIENGAKGTIKHCEIYGNEKAGILIQNTDSDPRLIECDIHHNLYGLWIYNEAKSMVEHCQIHDNELSGININDNKTSLQATSCQIHSNFWGIGISDGATAIIGNSDIFKNEGENIKIKNNETNLHISKCNIRYGNKGLSISDGATCRIEDCDISKNKHGNICKIDSDNARKNIFSKLLNLFSLNKKK